VHAVHEPTVAQRIEAAALLVAAVLAFGASGWSWWWFAALLLAADVSMVGYLAGPRVGAAVYNTGHALAGPALLLAWAWAGGPAAALAVGAVWLAHIGMDRSLGYGLKHPDGFHHTHLGLIGPARRAGRPVG
jgi:hypothetical protein